MTSTCVVAKIIFIAFGFMLKIEARTAMVTLQNWPRDKVLAEIKERGTSLRKISLAHGYHARTLYSALSRRWPRAEQIIADAIGVTPQEIWPSRYSE